MQNEIRGSVAVVINDMINANLTTRDDPERMQKIASSGLVDRTVNLVSTARAAELPIFWVQVARRADRMDAALVKTDLLHRKVSVRRAPTLAGSFEAQNVDALPIHPDDQVVFKPRMDPFIGTPLDLWLRARGIRTLVLGGYATNGGVESAMRTGADLGYDVIIASDCCYNVEEDAHRFALNQIMPYYSRVRTSDQIAEMIQQPQSHHEPLT